MRTRSKQIPSGKYKQINSISASVSTLIKNKVSKIPKSESKSTDRFKSNNCLMLTLGVGLSVGFVSEFSDDISDGDEDKKKDCSRLISQWLFATILRKQQHTHESHDQ